MKNNRQQNRLKYYDYSQNGAYFITICTKNRLNILCDIVGGGVLDAPRVTLLRYGIIVNETINEINRTYQHVNFDKYVIMPNHIHFIVIANDNIGSSGTPTPTNMVIPKLISTFKRFVNKKVGKQIWQRGYYDHIIRNSIDYERIWQYIDTNPIKWELDEYYTD